MNYEDMSDFEVNKAASSLVDFGDLVVTVNDGNEVVYLCDKDGFFDMVPISHFDPCNNPSDAWPIIVENNITIELSPDCTFEAYSRFNGVRYGVQFSNRNKALRAAMICFLKMKDAEK